MFSKLSDQIGQQLKTAYEKKCLAGDFSQSTLATRLNVDRAAISRRLSGKTNMTAETIADLVWALGYDIEVSIFDPNEDVE